MNSNENTLHLAIGAISVILFFTFIFSRPFFKRWEKLNKELKKEGLSDISKFEIRNNIDKLNDKYIIIMATTSSIVIAPLLVSQIGLSNNIATASVISAFFVFYKEGIKDFLDKINKMLCNIGLEKIIRKLEKYMPSEMVIIFLALIIFLVLLLLYNVYIK